MEVKPHPGMHFILIQSRSRRSELQRTLIIQSDCPALSGQGPGVLMYKMFCLGPIRVTEFNRSASPEKLSHPLNSKAC